MKLLQLKVVIGTNDDIELDTMNAKELDQLVDAIDDEMDNLDELIQQKLARLRMKADFFYVEVTR